MSKPRPPPPPDFAGAAQAQGAANVEAARTSGKLSNPNITTPLGSRNVTFGVGGDPDQVSIVESLSPSSQQRFEQGNRIDTSLGNLAESGLGNVRETLSQPFNQASLPAPVSGINPNQLPGGQGIDLSRLPQNPVSGGEEGRDAVTQALLARIEPQFQRDEERLRTRNINQGLRQGSEAFGADQDALNRARNDARFQAVLAGGQEQSRLFDLGQRARTQGLAEQQASQAERTRSLGEELASFQTGLGARQQGIQEQEFFRTEPLNILNAVRSSAPIQIPRFQQFQGQNVAPAPTFAATQLQGQNEADIFNAQAAARANFQQGLFGLGGQGLLAAGIAGSDRRLKREVIRLGEMSSGIPIYSFKYIGHDETHVGVMADEVLPIIPEAVVEDDLGIKYVDYERIH